MKNFFIACILILSGCTSDKSKTTDEKMDTFSLEPAKIDTNVTIEKEIDQPADTVKEDRTKDTSTSAQTKVYYNKRFKDVSVQPLGKNKFRVQGKGQIFEASFGWIIEDGHNEIKKGFEMTDAGAPEWGNFSFVVEAVKPRANSTLHLVLYETSAKDGSRQYELPIKLY